MKKPSPSKANNPPRERSSKNEMKKASPEDLPGVVKYVQVELKALTAVLELAQKRGKLANILEELKMAQVNYPTANILLPEGVLERLIPRFALLALCTGVAGTCTPTITSAVVSAAGAINFTYTIATTGSCKGAVFTVSVLVGGVGPQAQVTVEAVGTWTGKFTPPVGWIAGVAGNLSVTFRCDADKWCDTCAPRTSPPVLFPFNLV
jgi:hypothetical protein